MKYTRRWRKMFCGGILAWTAVVRRGGVTWLTQPRSNETFYYLLLPVKLVVYKARICGSGFIYGCELQAAVDLEICHLISGNRQPLNFFFLLFFYEFRLQNSILGPNKTLKSNLVQIQNIIFLFQISNTNPI